MFSAIAPLLAGVELVTELLSVAVLLMALDKLATAIRWTYAAGKFTGRIWFTYGLPAFLFIADGISAINAQIDWHEVAATVLDSLAVIAAAGITAAMYVHEWHANWVGSIDWAAKPVAPAAPAINPLIDIAASLERLTCKQVRAEFGLKQKTGKTKLIAMAIAC
jgi:hypothetical protein